MQGLLISVKRHIIFLFLLILLVFLLWLRIFVVPNTQEAQNISSTPFASPSIQPPIQVVNSTTVQITPAVNITLTDGFNYTFTGNRIELPPTLPVFNYEEPVILTKENATKLAQIFGFSGEPFLSGENSEGYPYHTWKSDTETFIAGGSFPFINYLKNNPQITATPSPFNIGNLKTSAINELNKTGIANIKTDNPKITYYKVAPYAPSINKDILEETDNPQSASYIKFSFPLTIDNYPVISQTYKTAPTYVILNQSGELFELFSFIVPPGSSTTIKTIPFSQIISNTSSNAVILQASSVLDINSETAQNYTLSEVDISNEQVVYFLPENFSYNLTPYILFKGKSFDTKLNKEVDVLVLTPVN